MGKGVGNINRGKKTGGKNTRIFGKRSNHKKAKYDKLTQKKNRKSAIQSLLQSGDTTINILRQNKSNPNANIIMSGKKRRKIRKEFQIRDIEKSKMDSCPLSSLPKVLCKSGFDCKKDNNDKFENLQKQQMEYTQ